MASSSQLAEEARRSRTSIVFLILSASSIYYSTQVYLNYPPNWWNWIIAVAGVFFFIIAMFLMYQDHQHESDYRDLLEREKRADVLSKEAEVKELQEEQAEAKQEAETPANIAKEGEPLPRS
ncbi:oligosaccharide repeat unit polymerase [Haloferax sp. Atlit-19N]|uniref:oligosaccharide repeat unit polymerase n=1 Tax=Haloferax sp. Atlit-19N TaxID=2077201 RepID=UPI0011C04BB8|nr:oligosaccharide repeat unit polymerase [Haloferax sp. Atlit-19N]